MTSQWPTGHDKAVRAVMDASDCSRAVDVNGSPYCEAHWVGWLSDVDACVRSERIAHEVLAALRAALAAGDADVAEALGPRGDPDDLTARWRRFVTDWTVDRCCCTQAWVWIERSAT